MSDFVNAIVQGDHRVRHLLNGAEVVNTAADGAVRMTRGSFEDAEKFGAVRRAPKGDREAAKAEAVVDTPPTEAVADERTDAKPGRRL